MAALCRPSLIAGVTGVLLALTVLLGVLAGNAAPAFADQPAADNAAPTTTNVGAANAEPAAVPPAMPGVGEWWTFTFSTNNYGAIGISIAIIGLVLGIAVRAAIRRWWFERARQTDTLVDDLLAAALARITFVFLTVGSLLWGLWFVFWYFIQVGGPGWEAAVEGGARTTGGLFLVYCIYHVIGVAGQAVKERFGRTKTEVDDQLAVLIMRLGKGVVLVVALVMILALFGMPVAPVLVGLAIVLVLGFLLAFDALRDVAGSLQLLGAPPFDVGHVIEIEGVVGVVRRIGLRTTMLETPERTQVVIPNHLMVRLPVENFSCRSSRRYSYTLELAPDTPVAALQEVVTAIGELLLAEPMVMRRVAMNDSEGQPLVDDHGQPRMSGVNPLVTIEAIEDGAISLLVQYDLTEVSIPAAAPVQQRLVLGVLSALEERGVQFANGASPGGDAPAPAATTVKPRKKPAPKKKKKTVAKKPATSSGSDDTDDKFA